MPCRDYDEYDVRKEIYDKLDTITKYLCWTLENHPDIVKVISSYPELGVWWREHQRLDLLRKKEENAEQQKKEAIKKAKAKLTAKERKLLGI